MSGGSVDKHWARRVVQLIHEPAAINAAQFLGNLAAAVSGFLAAIGGMPFLVTGTIGPVMAVFVGCVLLLGGGLGAGAVLAGAWWLERIALLIVALGWVLLLPAAITYAARPQATGAIWLVVALLFVALSDIFKRYRRIDWAYLDPSR